MASYKSEVQTAGDTSWTGNALRFATEAEAKTYVWDLMMRWTQVTDTRVVESSDPVNYAITDNELVRL